MSKHLTRLSKFLAVVLRHRPEAFDLVLDAEGFASLDGVWRVIQQKYDDRYSLDDLEQVVMGDQHGKQRYEIVGDFIRAKYGHSDVGITYEAVVPPEILYHGTHAIALPSILESGLQPQKRQYVHLTTRIDLALTVARRRTSTPILLVVQAGVADADGIVFYRADDETYLALAIPAIYIAVKQ